MRIVEGFDHARDGAVDELRIIYIAHILRLDEAQSAKEAQDILHLLIVESHQGIEAENRRIERHDSRRDNEQENRFLFQNILHLVQGNSS